MLHITTTTTDQLQLSQLHISCIKTWRHNMMDCWPQQIRQHRAVILVVVTISTHYCKSFWHTWVYDVSTMPVSAMMWLSRCIRPRKLRHRGGVNLHSILHTTLA